MSEYFPDAELRESDATLVGKSVVSGMHIQMLLGAVFVVVGCFVSAMGFSNGEMAAKIFGIVFALVGLVVLIGAVVKFMASSTLDPPEIQISASPLYLGEKFHGELVQLVKKRAQINVVTVTLICREWVQYTQGTNTTTETHDVLSIPVTLAIPGDIVPPDVICGEFEFTIPEDAMHSFEASYNRIDWLLQVHTDVAGWPDYNSDVALQVAPRYVSIKREN